MMAEVGIGLNLKPMEDTEPTRQSGEWDWAISRAQQEFAFPNSVIGQKWVCNYFLI